jgi:hypothetical protein
MKKPPYFPFNEDAEIIPLPTRTSAAYKLDLCSEISDEYLEKVFNSLDLMVIAEIIALAGFAVPAVANFELTSESTLIPHKFNPESKEYGEELNLNLESERNKFIQKLSEFMIAYILTIIFLYREKHPQELPPIREFTFENSITALNKLFSSVRYSNDVLHIDFLTSYFNNVSPCKAAKLNVLKHLIIECLDKYKKGIAQEVLNVLSQFTNVFTNLKINKATAFLNLRNNFILLYSNKILLIRSFVNKIDNTVDYHFELKDTVSKEVEDLVYKTFVTDGEPNLENIKKYMFISEKGSENKFIALADNIYSSVFNEVHPNMTSFTSENKDVETMFNFSYTEDLAVNVSAKLIKEFKWSTDGANKTAKLSDIIKYIKTHVAGYINTNLNKFGANPLPLFDKGLTNQVIFNLVSSKSKTAYSNINRWDHSNLSCYNIVEKGVVEIYKNLLGSAKKKSKSKIVDNLAVKLMSKYQWINEDEDNDENTNVVQFKSKKDMVPEAIKHHFVDKFNDEMKTNLEKTIDDYRGEEVTITKTKVSFKRADSELLEVIVKIGVGVIYTLLIFNVYALILQSLLGKEKFDARNEFNKLIDLETNLT